ncbi:hypothetical protein PoB_004037000 [Plakobranchus ocellatus]|uniref:Major facilitator superfamily (MFS) profile domain-containing protein n=1 Tax=Plakobranchus ocellatus TaxID=259542 RepID=A0AAV4B2N9_9GAST|nr:hypothetical protein PoB_004037000 [Plakobranchus ocellatus]
MVYYGLSLNVGNLSGNIYLNFFLSGVAELVAYVFCFLFLDIAGRKLLLCLSMFLGGIACLATMFPVMYGGEDVEWLIVALSLVGKFGITSAFAVIYVYSAELFPTVMRNSAIGLCSFTARIGGILAPYIGDLGKTVDGDLGIALPLIIFGSLDIVAGLLVLFLPETRNTVLPDTVEDAKNFGKQQQTSKNVYALDHVLAEPKKGENNPAFDVVGEE